VDRVEDGWFHWVSVTQNSVALVADGELSGGGVDAGYDEGALGEAVWDVPVVLGDGDGVVFVDVA
jgi:hypothetical protein